MNYNRPELLDKLAAEYALGTLRGNARRRFEALLRTLPAARIALDHWEARLNLLAIPLVMTAAPVRPPSRVWDAIDARTRPLPASAAEAQSKRWWSSLWKPALGFALGAALTIGVVRMMPGSFVSLDRLAQKEQALPQSYVGLLTDAQNQPTVLISSTRRGTRVTVKFLRSVTVPEGKVLQVWALPKEGMPFPLGVTTAANPPGKTEFEMSAASEKLLSNVPQLAISFEDAPAQSGGTPSELVLRGFCVKLW